MTEDRESKFISAFIPMAEPNTISDIIRRHAFLKLQDYEDELREKVNLVMSYTGDPFTIDCKGLTIVTREELRFSHRDLECLAEIYGVDKIKISGLGHSLEFITFENEVEDLKKRIKELEDQVKNQQKTIQELSPFDFNTLKIAP